MQNRWPSNEMQCVPVRIVDREQGVDGFIGGAPPQHVRPQFGHELRYFASIPFAQDPELQMSIFVADYERLLDVRGRIAKPELVQVEIHIPQVRNGGTTELESVLSSHGLELLKMADDWIEDDDGTRVVRSGHKLGGRPYLIRETTVLRTDLTMIAAEGFVHVVQFDFPSSQDANIAGSWPFGDGIFSLFGKAPFGAMDWRWYWDS